MREEPEEQGRGCREAKEAEVVAGIPGPVKTIYSLDFFPRYNLIAVKVYRQRVLDFKQGLKRVEAWWTGL